MKILVIGACTLDLSLSIEHLPTLSEDVNTENVEMALGGMAFNVYNIAKLFGSDCILGSPIGEGTFANITSKMLAEKNAHPIGVIPGQDNGFCVCLIDRSKERSFISNHGNEYRFDEQLFNEIDFDDIDYIYCDGLEIEDVDGSKIVDFLEAKHKKVFFAPGPRTGNLPKDLLKRILQLKPILHINEIEASMLSSLDDIYASIDKIYSITNSPVIITLGEQGCLLKENNNQSILIPTKSRTMIDANGAGDNHAGTILACLNQGADLTTAIKVANIVSGYVVMQKGSAMTPDNFAKALEEIKMTMHF